MAAAAAAVAAAVVAAAARRVATRATHRGRRAVGWRRVPRRSRAPRRRCRTLGTHDRLAAAEAEAEAAAAAKAGLAAAKAKAVTGAARRLV